MFRKMRLTVSGDPLPCHRHLMPESCLQNHLADKSSWCLHTQDRRRAAFSTRTKSFSRVWSSGCCYGPENSQKIVDSQFCFLWIHFWNPDTRQMLRHTSLLTIHLVRHTATWCFGVDGAGALLLPRFQPQWGCASSKNTGFCSGRKSFSFCATKSCSKETLFVAVFTYTRDTCKDIFPEPTCSATRDGSSGAGFARKGVQKENFVASSEQRKKEPVGVATVGSIPNLLLFRHLHSAVGSVSPMPGCEPPGFCSGQIFFCDHCTC